MMEAQGIPRNSVGNSVPRAGFEVSYGSRNLNLKSTDDKFSNTGKDITKVIPCPHSVLDNPQNILLKG